jgi:glutamyl-tRNA synthetase
LAREFDQLLRSKNIEKPLDTLVKIVSVLKERANFLNEFYDSGIYFFEAPKSYDEQALMKNWKEDSSALMLELITRLHAIDDFFSSNIEEIIKAWIQNKEIGFGKIMQPFRIGLVGALKGAHLFDIAEIIGKKETIFRIEKVIQYMNDRQV